MTTTNFEGGKSTIVSPINQLRRVTLACLLWEDTFYVSGEKSTDIIDKLCAKLSCDDIAKVALECSTKGQLRHIPLYLIIQALKRPREANKQSILSDVIAAVCKRPDQMTDLVALYWKDGKKMLPHQMRKGLKKAFDRFDEYQLSKYNRDNAVKLRDVAFLTHIKAGKFIKRGKLYADLVNKTHYPQHTKSGYAVCALYQLEGKPGLQTPDTWEVRLSAGHDKKESFQELLEKGKMGKLAIIRNLRNMHEAGVSTDLIAKELMKRDRPLLPFQFIAAAKACPKFEAIVDLSMVQSMQELPKLKGLTLVLVDVSGSMKQSLSAKSQMTRQDAAAGLSMILAEVCEKYDIFSFSEQLVLVPPRKGMALRDAIFNSQRNSGTLLGSALTLIDTQMRKRDVNNAPAIDRIIVITDEQSSDRIPVMDIPLCYIMNVGTYQNGIENKGQWTIITGFSENTIDYIRELEQ
ncbi:TROVE domain containing protein [uncultured Caudovirales phage]|uniref:TROVE domain containing protein n=1 Tax=uncultured Caudovirales phage TaxID=2100421 RepID=A0A6J5P0C3_9CAUD|nr:TROVE domain containing protein [uncultured Caudovirales phage]